MASKNNILKETVPFNFDDIYEGIANEFALKGYDSPYDGSNLAQLITSMAYTTSMLNANTAININETILTLAQKRPNIIQDARLLGYEPSPKISYIYELELEFDEDGPHNITKHMKFTEGANTYYYMGDDFIFDSTGGEKLLLKVKEGNLITFEDEPDNLVQIIANLQYLDIPYTNVEADGIECYITAYTSEGILQPRVQYFKSPTLLIDKDDNLSKKFIRLEDVDMKTPRIYFVLSEVGNPVPEGAIVEMNVLISKGPDGVMNSLPSGQTGINVLSKVMTVKGNIEESNDSIRRNAPVLHNTASRCVTANDYSVVARKHSACKEAYIFGGEDEHPMKLGHVYFCLTPEKMTREFDNDVNMTQWSLQNSEDIENNYLLDSEIESTQIDINGNIKNPGVLDNIKALNLPALRYEIRNPLYIHLDFDVTVVKYALASTHTDVRKNIFDIISNYIKELEKPETEFFKSNIQKRIDEYLTDITGLSLDVTFKIMIDTKSVSEETTQVIQGTEIVDVTEKAIHIYLDTPYEGLYLENGQIILDNLPRIDTTLFDGVSDLTVNFSNPSVVPDNDNELVHSKNNINFPVMLGATEIGRYTIYNDRRTYIKIKIFSDNLDLSATRYVDLKYPSPNIKTIRSSIFKLNSVKIH